MSALPREVADLAVEAPGDVPVRILAEGGRPLSVAIPLGPGGLPREVRLTSEAIQPGGETLFQGREWGPRGDGYRIDKLYRDGGRQQHRSLLLNASGEVLERSHSLPLQEVPETVLLTVMQEGRRDVPRIDIVSGPSVEVGYRAWTVDRIGRRHLVECDLNGAVTALWRILDAELALRVR